MCCFGCAILMHTSYRSRYMLYKNFRNLTISSYFTSMIIWNINNILTEFGMDAERNQSMSCSNSLFSCCIFINCVCVCFTFGPYFGVVGLFSFFLVVGSLYGWKTNNIIGIYWHRTKLPFIASKKLKSPLAGEWNETNQNKRAKNRIGRKALHVRPAYT